MSQMGQSSSMNEFNPERDLVPLCPNCHSVAHMSQDKNQPYTPQQIKEFLKENK